MATAALQHGLIATSQLTDHNIERTQFDQFVRRGIFVRVGSGVYAAAGAPDSWERSLRAGLLALGPQSCVSHEAAARLHRLDRSVESRPEFTVFRGRQGLAVDGVLHTTKVLAPLDVVTVDGFRATSATRTIVDLAHERVSRNRLAAAIDSAVRLGLTSPMVLIDAQRRNELQDAGRRVFEYTYEDVMRRPDHVIGTMEQRLTNAGWSR